MIGARVRVTFWQRAAGRVCVSSRRHCRVQWPSPPRTRVYPEKALEKTDAVFGLGRHRIRRCARVGGSALGIPQPLGPGPWGFRKSKMPEARFPRRPLLGISVNRGKLSRFRSAPWRTLGDATEAKPSKRGPVGGKGRREKRERPTRNRTTGLGFGSRRG
jgi:hypothetical protein